MPAIRHTADLRTTSGIERGLPRTFFLSISRFGVDLRPGFARARSAIPIPASPYLATIPRRRIALSVFASTTSRFRRPLDVANFKKKHFKRLLKRAKLPAIRLYDLRHTAASLLLANGEHPKVVQEMLGHFSITLTMDTYSHVMPDMQEQSAARLDALLSG